MNRFIPHLEFFSALFFYKPTINCHWTNSWTRSDSWDIAVRRSYFGRTVTLEIQSTSTNNALVYPMRFVPNEVGDKWMRDDFYASFCRRYWTDQLWIGWPLRDDQTVWPFMSRGIVTRSQLQSTVELDYGRSFETFASLIVGRNLRSRKRRTSRTIVPTTHSSSFF